MKLSEGWYRQQLSIVKQAKISFGKRFYPRDVQKVTGTCLYQFTYKGETVLDPHPFVILVGRGGGGPFFRFPPSPTSKAWGTYMAGINLTLTPPGIRNYLINKYGKLPYLPVEEAKKLGLFYISYRLYHVSRILQLGPVSPEAYMLLT
jgi:hypothetical protein